MHHFMSTPIPGTLTKCHTLSTALSLFHFSFLLPYNYALCFPPSLLSMMEQSVSLPPLPFLPSFFPLSCSVHSGEADRPHSKGRPRRPFLTRLSVTPLPHPSRPSFHPSNAPPPRLPTHPPTMYCLFALSFTLILSLAVYPISPIPLSIHLFPHLAEEEDRVRDIWRHWERETEAREGPVEGYVGWRWLWFLSGSQGAQGKDGFVFWQHRAVRSSVLVSFLLQCALALMFKHQHQSALDLQVRDSSMEEKGTRGGGGGGGITKNLRLQFTHNIITSTTLN